MKSQTFPTAESESPANRRNHGGGGNRTRATFPTDKARPWHHGAPLFLAICALAAAPLFNHTLGQVAVGVLFALWLLTLTSIKKQTLGAAPKRVRVKSAGKA